MGVRKGFQKLEVHLTPRMCKRVRNLAGEADRSVVQFLSRVVHVLLEQAEILPNDLSGMRRLCILLPTPDGEGVCGVINFGEGTEEDEIEAMRRYGKDRAE